MDSDARPLILHVVHSLSGGGTERTLLALLRTWDRSELRHAIVTLRDAGPLAAELPDEVACWSLGAVSRCRGMASQLRKVVRHWRPAVVHARNAGCWADTEIATVLDRRVRTVLGFHGLDRAGPFQPRDRCIAWVARRTGAAFTSVSHSGQMRLERELGVPRERITVLPNGVDRTRFAPRDAEQRSSTRSTLHIPDRAIALGIVGALTPVKRHDLLFAAAQSLAARVPDLHVVVVGDGPLRNELTQKVRSLGLEERVHWAGVREDVADVLAALDLYACTSDSEEMSNALLEAMASGLPVVTTNVGDHARIVRDGVEGLVVPTGCVRTLARAVLRLCETPALRRQLGAAVRRRSADFDFLAAAQAYESYYRRLLKTAKVYSHQSRGRLPFTRSVKGKPADTVDAPEPALC